jgi:hypothetical protein
VKRLLTVVAGVVLALTCVALKPALDGWPRPDHRHERLYFPKADGVRAASLGFHAAAADWLWLRTTQYYGGYRQGEHDLRYFDGLVAAVTALDPRFVEAYDFYSLVLCIDSAEYAHAVDVLKRGVLANPDDWRLPFKIGFINYVFLRQYEVAAMWFDQAAACPGATDFCRRFAAFSKRRAGDWRGSLLLWEELRRTTDSEDMRELAQKMVEKCRQEIDAQQGAAASEGH